MRRVRLVIYRRLRTVDLCFGAWYNVHMGIYSHQRKFTVRYSDVDSADELKPSAILSFAQEVAGTSADELGFGYQDIIPFGYGFLIVATYCEMKTPAHPTDVVCAETWPLPPRYVLFERDYRLTNEAGEEVAALASRWCLVDLKSGALLLPTVLKAHETCPYRNEQSTSPVWKIRKLGEEGREVYRLTAKANHFDHFHHVNNAKYADFFLDCFTEEELLKNRIKSFRITYSKQVKEGEEMVFYRSDSEGETIIELRVGGIVTTQFAVTFEARGNQ